jgi:hypothetical protein
LAFLVAAIVAQLNCSTAVNLTSQLPFDTTEQGFGDEVAAVGFSDPCDGGEGLWYSYVSNEVEILLIEVIEVGDTDLERAVFSGTCANLTCIESKLSLGSDRYQIEPGTEYFLFVGKGYYYDNSESFNIRVSVRLRSDETDLLIKMMSHVSLRSPACLRFPLRPTTSPRMPN